MSHSLPLWAVALPALLSGAFLLLATRAWRPRAAQRAPVDWAAAAAIAVGYAVAHAKLQGTAGDVSRWLLYAAPLLAAVGVADARWLAAGCGWLQASRWLLRGGLNLAFAWLLLRPVLAHDLAGAAGALAVGAVAAAGTLTWTVLDRLAAAERGPALLLMMVLLATAGAIALVLGGTASVGLLAAALAAALGGTLLPLWRTPDATRLRGAVPLVSLLLVGQWTLGVFYAALPRASFALLLLAGICGALGQLPPLRRARHGLALGVRLLAVGVVASGAVATAVVPPAPTASGQPAAGSAPLPAARSGHSGGYDESYGYSD